MKSEYIVFNCDTNHEGDLLKMEFSIGRCWELNEHKIMLVGLAASSEAIKLGETYSLPMVLDHKYDRVR